MKRLLVFCKTDWLHPGAGLVEHYAHEVLSRIADEGHYVAWVAHRPPSMGPGGQRPRVEVVDGIQVARIGMHRFYHTMMKMFLSSLTRRGPIADRFDLVLDFITHRPIDVAPYTEVPVIPVIFGLKARVHAAPDPPGPIIVPDEANRQRLRAAGVPSKFIVRAPVGVDGRLLDMSPDSPAVPRVAVFDRRPHRVLRALSRLHGTGCVPEAVVHPHRRLYRRAPNTIPAPASQWGENCRNATVAYCGIGMEHKSLVAQALGIPVLLPDTPAAREYVAGGETGLLHPPRGTKDLAEKLHVLLTEQTLRDTLGNRARQEACNRTWDKTARLILATIENL